MSHTEKQERMAYLKKKNWQKLSLKRLDDGSIRQRLYKTTFFKVWIKKKMYEQNGNKIGRKSKEKPKIDSRMKIYDSWNFQIHWKDSKADWTNQKKESAILKKVQLKLLHLRNRKEQKLKKNE